MTSHFVRATLFFFLLLLLPAERTRGQGEATDMVKAAVPTALLRLATLGDSVTAPYPADAPWGANGDRSWTEQILRLRHRKVDFVNVAVPGATSADVLANQAASVADLVARGRVDFVSIMVGSNDVFAHLPTLVVSGPEAFVQTFVADVATNIALTVDVVSAAGDVGLVIGNIPDVTITPSFQMFVSETFGDLALAVTEVTTVAITLANQQIEALAAAADIPVVDLFGLSRRMTTPFSVGGVEITNPYSPDYFHPNTIGQGIIGNTILGALHVGYHVPLQPLRLSDQEILLEAGLTTDRARPRTYFDVSRFVIFERAVE